MEQRVAMRVRKEWRSRFFSASGAKLGKARNELEPPSLRWLEMVSIRRGDNKDSMQEEYRHSRGSRARPPVSTDEC